MIVPVDHVEPVPRRIRAVLNGRVALDTVHARYVWEWPNYPHYYVPLADVDQSLLVDEQDVQQFPQGLARQYGIRSGDVRRSGVVRVHTAKSLPGLADMVRFEWDVFDSWFEEDEEVFVHPRNPYTRVDALRSTRGVRIELDGVLLAESSSPVMVFETGLPTRYYLNRTEVDFSHLVPSNTASACPYKGRTSAYWSARIGDTTYPDLAWSYGYPTGSLLRIAGLIAFYNEKTDVTLDGARLDRPETLWSK
ncbi:DUF427 domain-containing protein [Plantactinospora sp. CA-290183]|uniref:DUF427 domain-containing protein n=1 Tax=Plantactinospora sp. CA-290183 TaxID=3240006 RepID=UPI003D8E253F